MKLYYYPLLDCWLYYDIAPPEGAVPAKYIAPIYDGQPRVCFAYWGCIDECIFTLGLKRGRTYMVSERNIRFADLTSEQQAFAREHGFNGYI